MRKILSLTAILVVIFLVYSCNKEETLLQDDTAQFQEQELKKELQEFDYQEFRGCYDEVKTVLKKPSFETEYGTPTKIQFVYETGGEAIVLPLAKKGIIENLLWVNSLQEIYIVNRTDYLSREDIFGTGVAQKSFELFQLTPQQLSSSSNIRLIQRTLASNFLVSSSGSKVIIRERDPNSFTTATPNSYNGETKVHSLCNNEELADFYFVVLGLGKPGNYAFDKQIMVDALDEIIIDHGGYCICPTYCRLIDELTDKIFGELSEEEANLVYQGHILNAYDLPDDFPIDEYPNDLLKKLVDIDCNKAEWNETSDWTGVSEADDYPCPIWLEEHAEIENGIDVGESTVVDGCDESMIQIGESPNRGNANILEGDLTHGFDHNNAGVMHGDGSIGSDFITDDEYFEAMSDLFWITTGCDHNMRIVTDLFIETFRTNTSIDTEVSHPILSQKVANSHDFINYMKEFGLQLQNQLGGCDGDIEKINVNMQNVRPQFSGSYNIFHGLTILINDTEETNIYLKEDSFICDEDGWCIDVCVDILDHFGLDHCDVLEYQIQMNWDEISSGNLGHFGFNAWWMLQHRRNYVPFKTKVNLETTICGEF